MGSLLSSIAVGTGKTAERGAAQAKFPKRGREIARIQTIMTVILMSSCFTAPIVTSTSSPTV